MLKKMIMCAAVAGLVLALAPATQAVPIAPANLMGYWAFDGNNCDDSTANGFDGVLSASGAYSTDVSSLADGNTSVDLTSSAWVSVTTATNLEFNLTSLTTSFWEKGLPTGDGGIISKMDWWRGDDGWAIERWSGNENMHWVMRSPEATVQQNRTLYLTMTTGTISRSPSTAHPDHSTGTAAYWGVNQAGTVGTIDNPYPLFFGLRWRLTGTTTVSLLPIIQETFGWTTCQSLIRH